jgi:hypothetical protein
MSMLRLFRAGLVAAFIQCIAAGTVTLAFFLAVQYDLILPASPHIGVDAESELNSLLPLLRWIYLLIALWRKRSGGQVQHLEPAKAEQPKGSLAIALLSSNGCFCSSRCNQLMSSEHQKDRTRRRRAPCARRTSPWPCSTVTPHSNQGRGKLYAGFVTLSDRAKAATSGDGAVANWRISISVRLVYRRFASSNDEHVKQLVVACVMFLRLRPLQWQPC